MTDTPRYASLRDYLRVLREQWLVIALITLVAGGAALFVSLREDPVYEAVAAIAFQDETQQLGVLGGGSVSPVIPTAKTPQARVQTIDEPAVVGRVAESLPEPLEPGLLGAAISTSLDEESFLVDVTATWGESEFAAELANVFAREAASYTNEKARNQYDSAQQDTQSRLDQLGDDIAGQTERAVLTDQLTRLRFLAENAEPANVVETAQPPGAPISPRTTRNTTLGLLLGLAVGVLAAFLRDTLDRRLRGSREVHEELGYPVLGNVREEAMGHVLQAGGRFDLFLQQDIEALRIIRQKLEFLRRERRPTGRRRDDPPAIAEQPLRTIVVTSSVPAEGKSTVAAGLAFASAAAGKRTLLVEGDLRRPELATRLGLRPAPGLTDYLTGRAETTEVLQMVAQPPAPGAGNGPGAVGRPGDGTHAEPVVCVVCGNRSRQPAELLGSERFESFLDQVAQAYDAIIIDTSPLLPVADTLELLPHADAVVLCVRSGQTTRDLASQAKSALENLPEERPVGVVVTGLRKRDDLGYGYAYAPDGDLAKSQV